MEDCKFITYVCSVNFIIEYKEFKIKFTVNGDYLNPKAKSAYLNLYSNITLDHTKFPKLLSIGTKLILIRKELLENS